MKISKEKPDVELEVAGQRNELSMIETKCSIGAREDLVDAQQLWHWRIKRTLLTIWNEEISNIKR